MSSHQPTGGLTEGQIKALQHAIETKDPSALSLSQENEELKRASVLEFSLEQRLSLNMRWEALGRQLDEFNRGNSTIAFAFDIDGVLVRSATPTPGAAESIMKLQNKNIPFIFLTNGGGKTEKDHVALVGKRLGVSLDEDQFVQSHTPFRDLLPEFADKTILVLGGTKNHIRDVAHHYGFRKVLTSSDIVKAEGSHVHPFLELTQEHHEQHGRDLTSEMAHTEEGEVKISAIMVWSSPRDVGLDLQLVLDILLSNGGRLGTFSRKNNNRDLPNNGYLQSGQPKVYFCNPDLTWATSYKHPRVAQGMFKSYLEGGWHALTNGADLSSHIWMCGKPTRETYLYAEKTLLAYHRKVNGPNAPRIKTVYMVGDNPASDIQGANAFVSPTGIEWKSILVCTGVYQEGTTPAFIPTTTVKDVKAAVNWGIADGMDEWGVDMVGAIDGIGRE